MRVALATSAALPQLDADDRPLLGALLGRGVAASAVVWDDDDVDWSSYDAVVIRSTWDYSERRDHFVAWADEVGTAVPLFNGAETVRWNTHKGYLRELDAAGVPTVPTLWLARGSPPELPSDWETLVVKPAVSASAHGLLRGRADDGGVRDHAGALLEAGDVMVQPYFPAVESEGEISVVVIDGTVTHAVRKLPAAGDFRVQMRLGGVPTVTDVTPALRALAEQALGATAHGRDALYGRVDLLPTPRGPLVIELELVEPCLFLTSAPHAAGALADALVRRLKAAA